MRLAKPILGIVLAVAIFGGLYGWLHGKAPVPPASKPVTKTAKPAINTLPPLVPVLAPKMATVTKKQETMAAPTNVSRWSAVQTIVNSQAAYEDRLEAISSLGSQITSSDWEALSAFLLKPDPLDRVQNGQVIKNQVMDYLCSVNPPPVDLGDVLAKIYRDQQQDGVIRDYAVQHMGAYYEQIATQRNAGKALESVQSVLWDAVNETGDSVGGTALLALKRLSDEYPALDQNKIASTALQMAQDDNAGELSHITAYQVCAQMSVADSLPVILQAAQNGETFSVRISAIGSLGLLGGPDQIPFLNNLLDGPEQRLKPAAQHALEMIQSRHQSMSRNQPFNS